MFELEKIQDSIRYEGGVSRRLFLAYGAALASLPLFNRVGRAERNPSFDDNPFTLGVASGDPDHNGMVLWTRLATAPLDPDGGMGLRSFEVVWEIAEDDAFKNVVQAGTTFATPQLGHSVHVEVAGLKPDRWYWYRFKCGEATSPIGRTRTMPAPDAMPERLKFAIASCQHYEQGLFTAYEQMAQDELDLVFFAGDYIYEYAAGKGGKVRQHIGPETQSLDSYRMRYAQYRTDPDLAKMHATCPWFVTWDDHEFDNNCAGAISEQEDVDPASYLARRANAYQAYYEMMPLRAASLPQGHDMLLYRQASFGRLADFMVLDTRQYRTDQPNGDGAKEMNDAARNPNNTLLGATQKNWLKQKLIRSQSNWNILAQQVMMAEVARSRGGNSKEYFSMDQWPGYSAERKEMLKFMAERRVPNPVVLTGDIHSNWANELRIDDRNPEEDQVAIEFVTTSLSSGGNGKRNANNHDALMSKNPGVKFHNRERGYIRCTVTPETWTSDYMVCDDVLKPGGTSTATASFVVESGKSVINRA